MLVPYVDFSFEAVFTIFWKFQVFFKYNY